MTKERSLFYIRAILVVFVLSIAFPLSSSARILDKIVAVVNDEVITQSEVDKILYPIYQHYSKVYKTEEEIYKNLDKSRLEILKQLVQDRLILSEAKKLQVTVTDKEIDDRMEIIKKDIKTKGSTLERLIEEENMDLSYFREKQRTQLIIEKTITREVGMGITIQPSEVDNYYNAHMEDYSQPEQVAIFAILIKVQSERTPLESRQLADDVHKMAKEGADFITLAKNYSEGPNRENGGDLGYVMRGQLLEELDKIIFSLEPGDISKVIESPIGYHICKVYDKKKEKLVPLEDVRHKVTETIYKMKWQESFEDWIEKLKSNAYISIK